METLQKTFAFNTNRGMYSPSAHRLSNDYGIVASDFLQRHGFVIKYVVTNPEYFEQRPYYVGDGAEFDIVATKNNITYCFELDVKTIKNWKVRKWSNNWPSQFATVDFVYQKYNKQHIEEILQKKNHIGIALMCLNYLNYEDDYSTIGNPRYMWSITFKNLFQQPVEDKVNSRTGNERFYVVPTKHLKWTNLNL